MSGSRDPWQRLLVIERLEVGPALVEPRRVVTPYRIVTSAGTDQLEFVYRYTQDVLDPASLEDRNLAAVMGAQVAINYGLFCREMVFHGPIDRHDRRFLESMIENTSREITVKKFLEPNVFLTEEVARLPAVRRRRFTQASINFPASSTEPVPSRIGHGVPNRQRDSNRCVILSSGGKESLLSLGLLREIGVETFPFFVNESGRHWLTALNAFRDLSRTHPGTDRVWTNSDRVFSWFLHHLPFIRHDFSTIRADEYPIRLWTVAVFLFGALPILRKSGAGRLVIGDEFDTTRRARHRGIPHYDGLYDQSRFFDRAMTRYFHRKGWNIEQFSVVRNLSELLVQKILVERYPELLRLQVSCHAAHTEGEQVHPCGRCEKCRRIVGMLVALNQDPATCGYSSTQVDSCLRALAATGAHQEPEAVEHLIHLLVQKNALPESDGGTLRGRLHPEIESLRFHPERASVHDIPADLRQPVYRILRQHARGAVQRVRGRWQPFQSAMLRDQTPAMAKGGSMPDRILLGELTWPEAKDRFAKVDIALLPVGAVEQHGPHLPLDTDAFDADYLAKEVSKACSEPRPLVLPLIPYGVSYHHEDFEGTIHIGPDTLAQFVYEVGISAANNGIRKLIIINGHGGNGPALNFAAQMINRDARIFTCVDSGETSDHDVEKLAQTPNDVHAGEIETSTSLANRPYLVRTSKMRKEITRFSIKYLDFSSTHSVNWYARTAKISKSGVLGDPTKASAEKGREMWAIMIRHLVELVEHIKELSLEEIHQAKY